MRAALQKAFKFGQRDFGQPLANAEVVLLLQQVSGVAAVVIETLAPRGGTIAGRPPNLEVTVTADRAHWDQTLSPPGFVPAELLQLCPTNITLNTEIAS